MATQTGLKFQALGFGEALKGQFVSQLSYVGKKFSDSLGGYNYYIFVVLLLVLALWTIYFIWAKFLR